MYIAEGQTKFQIINTSPNELFVSYKGPDDAEYIKLKIGAFEVLSVLTMKQDRVSLHENLSFKLYMFFK